MNRLLATLLEYKWTKLFSIALALAVWLYVSQKGNSDRTNIRVPLEIVIPADTFTLSQSASAVLVSLRGPTSAMDQLRYETLLARIDLSKNSRAKIPGNLATPLQTNVRITPADIVNLAPSIHVTSIEPADVTLTIDQMDEKRMEVKVVTKGDVKPGFRVYQAYPSPREVIVRGPKSILARRDTIPTLPVLVDGLGEGKWQPPRDLDTSDPLSHLTDCLKPDPTTVTVWIEVVAIGETRVLKNVPLEVIGLPGIAYTLLNSDKTKPFTEIPEVEIRGPKDLLDKPDLHAFLDLTDVKNPKEKPEENRLVQFRAAPQIEILTKPPSVIVQIKTQTP